MKLYGLYNAENKKKMGSFKGSTLSLTLKVAYKKTPTIVIYSQVVLHSFVVFLFSLFVFK